MNVITPDVATATQRALKQWDEYQVDETATPGLFRVTRNGASYLTSANTCSCPHATNRKVVCKHQIRVRAKLAARTHWAEDEAEAKSARALADRRALWD